MNREIKFMNREIKFRAWDKKAKLMHKWCAEMQLFDNVFWEMAKNEEMPIMQFTGLKDKKKKKIYEGDILKVLDPYSRAWSRNGAEVVFSDGYVGGWALRSGINFLNIGTRQDQVEIIGNIHENPNLLKND